MGSIHKKRILITGCTGYLAGRIFQRLEKFNNYHFILGCRDISKASSLHHYKDHELKIFDISKPETFMNALTGIDAVVHLASMNVQDSQGNPELAQKINVEMVQKLVDESIKYNVSQFIYMSTFHVYGPDAKGLITEETPTNPKSVYAKTHLEAEKIVTSNERIHGCAIRLSNAIGMPLIKDISAWKLVANDLCNQALNTKKMVLSSTGDQKRDFVAVSCIGDAIHTLLSTSKNKKTASSIYNLGSETTMTIFNMAQLIQESCRVHLGFTPAIERKIDPNINIDTFPMFTYSTKKLRSLGFEISVSLKEEIKNTLTSREL